VKVVVDDLIPYNEGKDVTKDNFGKKWPVNARMSPDGAWW